ncbi:MAG: iron ABC transporter permease [Planctomycetota bacterium]
MTRHALMALGALIALTAVAALLGLLTGEGRLAWPEASIIQHLRAVETLSAATCGAALAVAGALLQAVLRNPLASPFVLGVSSGAGLAIVVSTYIGYATRGVVVGGMPSPLAVAIGAFAALALVYTLGQRRGLIDPPTLLLAGVMIALLCGSLAALVRSLLPDAGLAVEARWLLGSIDAEFPAARLTLYAAGVLLCVVCSAWLGPALDRLALGDDAARSLGVRVAGVRLAAFALAGTLTSFAVLIAGPVGFVGLVAPHLVRWIAGAHHRPLIIGAALAGAALLMAAEATTSLVRTPSGRLPVGVVTALVGGPVFLALLMLRRDWSAP